MTAFASFVLKLTAAALLTSIVAALAGRGTMGALVRFLGGLFMAVTLASPLVQLELPDPEKWIQQFSCEGASAAAMGEEMAAGELRSIIKDEVEAYILDKAALYSLRLEVNVELNEDNVPVGAVMTGKIPPAHKERLSRLLETELGIGREAQKWIE